MTRVEFIFLSGSASGDVRWCPSLALDYHRSSLWLSPSFVNLVHLKSAVKFKHHRLGQSNT